MLFSSQSTQRISFFSASAKADESPEFNFIFFTSSVPSSVPIPASLQLLFLDAATSITSSFFSSFSSVCLLPKLPNSCTSSSSSSTFPLPNPMVVTPSLASFFLFVFAFPFTSASIALIFSNSASSIPNRDVNPLINACNGSPPIASGNKSAADCCASLSAFGCCFFHSICCSNSSHLLVKSVIKPINSSKSLTISPSLSLILSRTTQTNSSFTTFSFNSSASSASSNSANF